MTSSDSEKKDEQKGQAIVPKELSEVEKVKRDLEEERSRSQEYLTRLKYLQADFENYRRRSERETTEIVDLTKELVFRRLLGVIDSLELAVAAGRKSRGGKSLLSGVEMTLGMLMRALKEEGLETIEAVGQPYDPERHEAVDRVAPEGEAEEKVVEEVRRGFAFKGKVIRRSMVVTSASSHPGKSIDRSGDRSVQSTQG